MYSNCMAMSVVPFAENQGLSKVPFAENPGLSVVPFRTVSGSLC